MANTQQIKKRRNSVKNIGKITNAMQLVSTAKSKKAMDSLFHSRDYYIEIEKVLHKILNQSNDNIFSIGPAKANDVNLWILISSNIGMCGSFNSQVFKEFEKAEKKPNDIYISIGSKATTYLKRNGYKIYKEYSLISNIVFGNISKNISDLIIRKVTKGEIKSASVIYTEFVNQITYNQKSFMLYPLSYDTKIIDSLKGKEEDKKVQLLSEIKTKEDVREFVKLYTSVVTYGMLSESYASEQVARRVSMENATSNSNELVEKLDIEYNRKRQAIITQQITEIIGGSE